MPVAQFQGLDLSEGASFTVHQPWHELTLPGVQLPVLLVHCATPGHITTYAGRHGSGGEAARGGGTGGGGSSVGARAGASALRSMGLGSSVARTPRRTPGS